MTIATYEGVVEKGKIKLMPGVKLPDNAKVYVIVPDMQTKKKVRILSPRLVNRKQALHFKMKVSDEQP